MNFNNFTEYLNVNISTTNQFNSSNHSISDMTVLGLLYAPTDSSKIKTLRKRTIDNIRTLKFSGLNKQFYLL